MKENSADSISQNIRKDTRLDSQYKTKVGIGDTIDLFSDRGQLPVPYKPKVDKPRIPRRVYEDSIPVTGLEVDFSDVGETLGLVAVFIYRLCWTLVPLAAAGGGLFVIGTGIYMIVTWTYFIHAFISLIVTVFFILTVPQSIRNHRQNRTPKVDSSGTINIFNNVSAGGKEVNIFNNITQE